MAECNKNRSSGSIENSDYKTDSVVNKKEKSSFLFYSESNFAWKGDLKSLKAFVATILTCDDAKWSSPRAEEKLFKTAEFSLKWHGPKKEKLQIMKDNENKYLQSVLEANAQTNATKNVEKKIKTRSHVVDANRQQQDDLKQNTNQNHSMCTKCQDYQQQIDNIMTLVAEIKTKQLEETQRAESKSAKLEININALSEQNNKMAAEIEQLKSTIVELDGDNANIKCVLDIKQNEWTKVDTKAKKSTRNVNTNKIPLKANTFQMLDVEESNPRNGYNHKEASQTKTTSKGRPTHHRNRKESNMDPRNTADTNKRTHHRNRKESNMDPRNTADTNKRRNQEKQEKAVLVIGDSMVKHIDGNKIARAARNKAISHSYSGATVNQISAKFDDQTEKSQYDTIILHVGTNDLVHEESEKVAADMDNLINKAKGHTNKVAVSGAIKRYDGKVNNRKIDYYNKLVHDLCSKHKITYIDNSYIEKSLLNRSNLHLNRDGDKALGRAFCTYLKSNRIQNSNNHFFRPPPGRQKEWTMYISHVKRMMKHKLE